MQSISHVVTAAQQRYPIPNIDFTHLLLTVGKGGVWIKVGDSNVTVAPRVEGAIYIPPETVIELPSRIINFEELTHYAVVSHTADTHININWEWNPMTEMDLLVNIHDCLMESMRRTWGDAAHPHYPLQHEQHIDEEEFPPGY
jgi:hypothetical protein